MQILVIGGGASGMMAAISAAEAHPNDSVLLLERQARVGRKLLATGNGRCNLSNMDLNLSHFHGGDPAFVLPALSQFDPIRWFRDNGLLMCTEPSGRIYPHSDSANSVLDVLRFALSKHNLSQRLGCEVRSVKKQDGQFRIRTDAETFSADRVIVANGGLAGTRLGGGMSGYQILRSFGHKCTKLCPSLVQVNTESTVVRSLKGIRADARLMLRSGDRVLAENTGEVQFTQTGVSGPAVFEISRFVSTAPEQDLILSLDLLREYSKADITAMLRFRSARHPELTAADLLTGMVHNRLGRTVVRCAGVDQELPLSALSAAQIAQIAQTLKCFSLPVSGTMGMDCAQVTAGGIATDGFYSKTLESRLCSGLYACGEVLDIDGDCGGYNLHWAWTSGHLAGLIQEEPE